MLGFPPPMQLVGQQSIAGLLLEDVGRSGVYLLGFAGGTFYIGLATDVVRRFAQHRRAHGDRVLAFAFLPTHRSDLTVVERDLIRRAERAGIPLEQTQWKSEIYGKRALDDLFSEADFQRWQRDPSSSFADVPWVAPQVDVGRVRRDTRRFLGLLSHPQGECVLRLLSRFTRACLPGARRTVHDFWSISCLPNTNAATWPRLACLSAHVMEVLVLGTRKGTPGSLWGFLVCARTTLEAAHGSMSDACYTLRADAVERATYRSAGHDQCVIRFSANDQAHALLDQESVRAAAGLLLYRVMRKGFTPYANRHNTVLAEHLLASTSLPGE